MDRSRSPAVIGSAETCAAIDALKPVRRARPLIAILGANGDNATEMTDYMMPYGILRRADVAEVIGLATWPGTVRLFPTLEVEPDATIAQFDEAQPDGADYVIVPAMLQLDDPAVTRWIRNQARKGAIIVGICAGSVAMAAAGLLKGKQATTHWYYRRALSRADPTLTYVPNRRFVVDGKTATTTGITAGLPFILTLINAIGGKMKAIEAAKGLGLAQWDARHNSAAFAFSARFAATVAINRLAFWRHDRLSLALRSGIDEAALALVSDAWSRTYRSQICAYTEIPGPIVTQNGLRVVASHLPARQLSEQHVNVAKLPVRFALDQALAAIAIRYGKRTASIVAAQLEYPMTPAQKNRG